MFPDHELVGRGAGWGGFRVRVVYPLGTRRWRRVPERHALRCSARTEEQTTEHKRYDGLRVGVKVEQGRRSTLVGIISRTSFMTRQAIRGRIPCPQGEALLAGTTSLHMAQLNGYESSQMSNEERDSRLCHTTYHGVTSSAHFLVQCRSDKEVADGRLQ